MKRKSLKLILCGAAVFAASITGSRSAMVQADMGNYNFVSIDSGVVDSITVNGVTVEALYRPYDVSMNKDATYSCAAFVKRFYNDIYGMNVYNLMETTSTPQMDGGSFEVVSAPQVGDIIRDNVSVHWAIVKEVNGNTVTVIQQNAWNEEHTAAWVGATIENGDPRYTFFRAAGSTGTAMPEGNYTIYYDAPQVQEANATVSAQVDNPNRVCVNQVGISLWDSNGNLLMKHTEDCQRPESRFNMWYDIQNELGITLEPGNTYTYQFFVVQNGQEYPGNVESFTTGGTPFDSAAFSEEAYYAIGKLQELFGWASEEIEEVLGHPTFTRLEVDRTICHYPLNTLLGKDAKVIITFEKNRAAEVKWKYSYPDNSAESVSAGEDLYWQITAAADSMMYSGGLGTCKDVDNLTMTYGNELKVVKDVEETPYVSISVFKKFDYKIL